MATLERIRQRSGLLIVIIGVAMLAFILTDLLGSGNSILRADANVIGVVEGETVELPEFQAKMTELRTRIEQQNPQQAAFLTDKQVADGVWNEIVREKLMQEQYDELGIQITSAELYKRLMDNPNIQSAAPFQDPNGGGFNEGLFQQYINNIESNRGTDEQASAAYAQWIDFEKSEKINTLQTKYNKAIEKGLYVPMALGKDAFVRNSTTVNARVAVMEYATVPDSTVEITDADYKKYYNENKELFKAEKAASIQFVSFNVVASEEDRTNIKDELKTYIGIDSIDENGNPTENFRFNDNDSAYAAIYASNRGTPTYYTKDNLPQGLDSTVMDQETGFIAGPYEANNSYIITKITDKRMLPDSVSARHILISFDQAQQGNPNRTGLQAKELADSLLKEVQADTSKFRALAIQVSDDKVSGALGGDLGTFGPTSMVKPFADFSFQNEVGEIGLVFSQFGFHIIEITEQKGASQALELVSIDREIGPSEATRNIVYEQASGFASQVNNAEEFGSKAEELGYAPRVATSLKEFDESIPGLGSNREIVKWANGVGFDAVDSKVGDVQVFTRTEPYVVAILTNRNEKGFRDLESVKAEIETAVVNQKKAEGFKEKMNTLIAEGADMNTIIQKLSMSENTANVNFSSVALGPYGSEAKVIGAITALNTGEMSNPVIGIRGVYIAEAKSVNNAEELPDYTNQKAQEEQTIRGRVPGGVFEAIKDNAKLDDRRAKFF